MSNIAQEIVDAVSKVDPDSIAIQAAKAAIETISEPTPAKLVDDLSLALELVKKFKEEMNGLHPSVVNIIKAIF